MQDTFAPYSLVCPTVTWREARGHQTYVEYESAFRKHGEELSDYFIMTVVRNPWAWHVSWFNYVRAQGGGKRSGLKVEHKQFRKMEFSDYLVWLKDPTAKTTPPGIIKRQLSDWILDSNGVVRANAILRQETLYDDVVELVNRLGIAIEPKQFRRNVSTTDDYRNYYTSQDIENVAQRHQRDIELFGYEFS